MSNQWTDAFLDEMRTTGDALADNVVATLFAHGGIGTVNLLMKSLVHNDGLPSEQLPKVVQEYLAQTSVLPQVDRSQIRKGEEVFESYGPEIMMVLGFYSLPAAYAAAKGVQVLYRTEQ